MAGAELFGAGPLFNFRSGCFFFPFLRDRSFCPEGSEVCRAVPFLIPALGTAAPPE